MSDPELILTRPTRAFPYDEERDAFDFEYPVTLTPNDVLTVEDDGPADRRHRKRAGDGRVLYVVRHRRQYPGSGGDQSYLIRGADLAPQDDYLQSARDYLANETVWRVERTCGYGQVGRVSFVEATREEECWDEPVTVSRPYGVGKQVSRVVSVRRATADDVDEFLRS